MNRKRIMKIMLYISILAISILLWSVTDNIFSLAESKKQTTDSDIVEILAAGSIEKENIIPTTVKDFEKNFSFSDSAEKLEHYDVRGKNKNSNVYGYVQIWESKQSLEQYLSISKEYMSSNVYGFYESDITINGIKWKKWDYIVNSIAVSQGFLEYDGKIYFCCLCVPYKEKTYSFDKIFIELLELSIDT